MTVVIGKLATPHPIRVMMSTPAREAAIFMADEGIGDVIVIDEASGAIAGILTDRDIVVRLVAPDLDLSTPVGEICTTDVTTIDTHSDTAVAVAMMREHGIRRLPVVDSDRRPVGIVSIEDLARSDTVTTAEIGEIVRDIAEADRDHRHGL